MAAQPVNLVGTSGLRVSSQVDRYLSKKNVIVPSVFVHARCCNRVDNICTLGIKWKNRKMLGQIGWIIFDHSAGGWIKPLLLQCSSVWANCQLYPLLWQNWFISLKTLLISSLSRMIIKKRALSRNGNQWLASICITLTVSDWWLHDGWRPWPWLGKLPPRGQTRR